MFKGNVNGDGIRKNVFEVPIIAQWIRINPTRWRDRIALRVELYGCDYGKISFYCNQLYYKAVLVKYRKLLIHIGKVLYLILTSVSKCPEDFCDFPHSLLE
jgi:hypothetical protein